MFKSNYADNFSERILPTNFSNSYFKVESQPRSSYPQYKPNQSKDSQYYKHHLQQQKIQQQHQLFQQSAFQARKCSGVNHHENIHEDSNKSRNVKELQKFLEGKLNSSHNLYSRMYKHNVSLLPSLSSLSPSSLSVASSHNISAPIYNCTAQSNTIHNNNASFRTSLSKVPIPENAKLLV